MMGLLVHVIESDRPVGEHTMIYEIRNYHYEPSLINEYRAWATDRARALYQGAPRSRRLLGQRRRTGAGRWQAPRRVGAPPR